MQTLMKKKRLLAMAIAGAVLLAGTGAALLYLNPTLAAKLKPGPKSGDAHRDKYVTLDKVIVMLKRADDESVSHYMAVDLVFKTSHGKERETKEQFPLLRSIAVKTLSGYTSQVAGTRKIEQVVADLDRAFSDSYGQSGTEKPFSDVMIGKLVVE